MQNVSPLQCADVNHTQNAAGSVKMYEFDNWCLWFCALQSTQGFQNGVISMHVEAQIFLEFQKF